MKRMKGGADSEGVESEAENESGMSVRGRCGVGRVEEGRSEGVK